MRAGAHDFVLKDRLTRLTACVERELRETKARVEKIVADFAVLQAAMHLPLLGQSAVLDDLGLTPEQLRTRMHWVDRVHPDDLRSYQIALIAHFKGGLPRSSSAFWNLSQASCVNVSTISLPFLPCKTTTFPPGPISRVRLSESVVDWMGRPPNRARAAIWPECALTPRTRAITGCLTDQRPIYRMDSWPTW